MLSGCDAEQTRYPIATEIAKAIKAQIREELSLTASAGVAPNKFLAKIASGMDKPDGLFVIKPHQVEAFLEKLPVKKRWGVGPVTEKRLQSGGNLQICKSANLQIPPPRVWQSGR